MSAERAEQTSCAINGTEEVVMKGYVFLAMILPVLFLSGCGRGVVGGAAVGAGAAGV